MDDRISIAAAKARLAECIRQAERGRTLVLTRHGRPVARLVPFDGPPRARPAGEVRETEARYPATELAGASKIEDRQSVFDSHERKAALVRAFEAAIWPRLPEDQVGKGVSKREREEILGYAEEGS